MNKCQKVPSSNEMEKATEARTNNGRGRNTSKQLGITNGRWHGIRELEQEWVCEHLNILLQVVHSLWKLNNNKKLHIIVPVQFKWSEWDEIQWCTEFKGHVRIINRTQWTNGFTKLVERVNIRSIKKRFQLDSDLTRTVPCWNPQKRNWSKYWLVFQLSRIIV